MNPSAPLTCLQISCILRESQGMFFEYEIFLEKWWNLRGIVGLLLSKDLNLSFQTVQWQTSTTNARARVIVFDGKQLALHFAELLFGSFLGGNKCIVCYI